MYRICPESNEPASSAYAPHVPLPLAMYMFSLPPSPVRAVTTTVPPFCTTAPMPAAVLPPTWVWPTVIVVRTSAPLPISMKPGSQPYPTLICGNAHAELSSGARMLAFDTLSVAR